MARGRKPKPTAIKRREGNPGRRPLNENEPVATGLPDPPEHLEGEALAEWERAVPELQELGVLARVDRTALAAYCVVYGRWVQAEEHLAVYGMTVTTPNGYSQQSPYLSISNKALQQMRQYLTEFGMTPSSRTRIAVQPSDGKSKEAEEFLFGKKDSGKPGAKTPRLGLVK